MWIGIINVRTTNNRVPAFGHYTDNLREEKERNMKHTPGPWECRKNCDIISRSTGDWIGEVTLFEALNGCIGMKQSRANAHLIAAAPDLLEAAIMVLDNHDLSGTDAGRALEAAINKALNNKDVE